MHNKTSVYENFILRLLITDTFGTRRLQWHSVKNDLYEVEDWPFWDKLCGNIGHIRTKDAYAIRQ